jgi:hypothetical protein
MPPSIKTHDFVKIDFVKIALGSTGINIADDADV